MMVLQNMQKSKKNKKIKCHDLAYQYFMMITLIKQHLRRRELDLFCLTQTKRFPGNIAPRFHIYLISSAPHINLSILTTTKTLKLERVDRLQSKQQNIEISPCTSQSSTLALLLLGPRETQGPLGLSTSSNAAKIGLYIGSNATKIGLSIGSNVAKIGLSQAPGLAKQGFHLRQAPWTSSPQKTRDPPHDHFIPLLGPVDACVLARLGQTQLFGQHLMDRGSRLLR